MIKTTTQQLEENQAAQSAILSGGQSYTLNGRTVTRANLAELRLMEKDLKHQLAIENGSNPVVSSVNFAGMGY